MDVRGRGRDDHDEKQDTAENLNPPRTQLVFGPLYRERDCTPTALTLDAAADVYNISADVALEILFMNIEFLGRATIDASEESSISASPVSGEQTPRTQDSNEQETKSARVTTEFHCFQTTGQPAGRERHDLIQQNVLAKKFVSKKEPPIPLKDYLLRLYRYCPMSTAVYLATSVYLTRMSAVEGVISVVPKNVHRLVLAGLRVATKALEDLSYPHRRFAMVGGVSERELSKLETSFCFLADFELRVDAEMLIMEARSIQSNIGLLVPKEHATNNS